MARGQLSTKPNSSTASPTKLDSTLDASNSTLSKSNTWLNPRNWPSCDRTQWARTSTKGEANFLGGQLGESNGGSWPWNANLVGGKGHVSKRFGAVGPVFHHSDKFSSALLRQKRRAVFSGPDQRAPQRGQIFSQLKRTRICLG